MREVHLEVTLPSAVRDVRVAEGEAPSPEEAARLAQREQAAYERGRQEGRAEGERVLGQQLLEQRAEMAALQQGVLQALREAVPQVIRDCEQALTTLALELARKIVADTPISPELVERVVREALEQARESAECHIYLHPEDLALLEKHDASFRTRAEQEQRLIFHPAPEIQRGGCVVKTDFGVIDAQRDTKIARLKQTLCQ